MNLSHIPWRSRSYVSHVSLIHVETSKTPKGRSATFRVQSSTFFHLFLLCHFFHRAASGTGQAVQSWKHTPKWSDEALSECVLEMDEMQDSRRQLEKEDVLCFWRTSCGTQWAMGANWVLLLNVGMCSQRNCVENKRSIHWRKKKNMTKWLKTRKDKKNNHKNLKKSNMF